MGREPTIAIIGAGRLGASLAAALLATGYRVTHVASRTLTSADELAATLDRGITPVTPQAAVASADIIFLTVPDDEIAPLCDDLRWRKGQWVVQSSGAQTLDVLRTATAAGALAGCIHPLQTFPSRQPETARFRGITVGIEAQPPLDAFLESVAAAFGAASIRLENIDRARYHAAAVFASNDVIALMSAAARTWESAGLPLESARAALAPLLVAAAANVAAMDLGDALTGPIARGDVATVQRHLEALQAEPALHELYAALARELLQLPLGHAPAVTEQLKTLLA